MGLPGRGSRERVACALSLLLLLCSACATLPRGQYGITNIEWTGVDDVSEEAIETCLVTRERESTSLRLGLGTGSCGSPPFDSSAPKIELWTLPWIEWPLWDPAIFDLDKQRILRWYRARGYYDTQVTGVHTYVDGHVVADPIDCNPDKSSCELEVAVQVVEGEPVRVQSVVVESKEPLPEDVLEQIQDELTVRRDERFDEFAYEADKQVILELLWNASFARAEVSGRVEIDREQRVARVVYLLEPGPACVFGTIRVEGAKDLPEHLIIEAADIREGAEYSHEALLDAEQAIFSLGVFSSVQLKPLGEGSRVDLLAEVRAGRIERWSGGFGIMSGTLVRSYDQESIPQWDIHLVAAYEHKSFLGGMRRLRLEERPRLIMLDDFPGVPASGPRFGNVVSLRFEQPAAIERRTTLFFDNIWDFGPDAYDGFFRHDLRTKVGLSRPFWRHRIQARVAVGHDIYDLTDSDIPENISSYRLPYLEQQVSLDLRNNPQRPRRGIYTAVTVQEAFRLGGYGSWDYVRVTPEVRGYVPLMWDFVLAARFAVGALFIQEREPGLDEDSDRFGPRGYRLRGGGANSNRGFSAGTLGQPRGWEDDPENEGQVFPGGIRRWEASLEVRIPFGEDFGLVLFGDMGDVGPTKRIRFERLNTALGFGLRYHTIIGAIRFDAGWRIPGWQVVGDSDDPENDVDLKGWPSAFHLTIGEAF